MVTDNKGKIIYTELLREDLLILRFVPENGIMPKYKTGQFLTIGMSIPTENYKIVRRAYSIASNPENTKYFEFVIRWVRKPLQGRVTTQLFYATEGDEILWGNPTGAALQISDKLQNGKRDKRRIICVGGGTGIAPFVAFANHLRAIKDKREIIILHGASYVDELSYKRMFTDLQDQSKQEGKKKWNFAYRAAISRPKERFNRSWSGQTGRVESFFKTGKDGLSPIEDIVGEKITPENTIIYICGYQGTIDGVIEYVGPKGFVTEHDKNKDGSFAIKFESYG